MEKILNGRSIFVLVVTVLSLWFVTPTAKYFFFVRSLSHPPTQEQKEQQKLMLEEQDMIKLGLDLQGGVEFLIAVDTDYKIRQELRNVATGLRENLEREQVEATVEVAEDERSFLLRLTNPADLRVAQDIINDSGFRNTLRYDSLSDLASTGTTFRLNEENIVRSVNEATEGALKIVRNRVDEYGLTNPEVIQEASHRIRVRIPGEMDPDRIQRGLLRTANLEFRMVHPNLTAEVGKYVQPGTIIPGLGTGVIREEYLEKVFLEETSSYVDRLKTDIPDVPAGYRLFLGKDVRIDDRTGEQEEIDNLAYLLKDEVELAGENLTRAAVYTDFQSFDSASPFRVSLEFDGEGTEKFAEVTTDYEGERFAILLDGIVMSAPTIREPILGGRCEISGSFSQAEAHDLALVLKAGALPAPLKIIDRYTVDASLGADSVVDSGRALMIGGVALVIFMFIVYQTAGLVAVTAMILNVLLILAILSLANATLTLSGIGGILLTMGMAVDANVLIYERLREELDEGKTMRAAVNAAFGKAFSVIVDSNITTLLPALVLILFEVVEGSVRSFWTALAIGLVVNLYTGLTVTRAIIEAWIAKRKTINVGKIRLFKNSNFDFMNYRRLGYPLSAAILIVCVGYLAMHGPNLGIDFTGGVLAVVETRSPDVTRASLEQALTGGTDEATGFESVKVVKVLNEDLFQVTVPGDDAVEIEHQITSILSANFGDETMVASAQGVDPVVGREFQVTALWTVLVASLVILSYIAFRFRPVFGLGAVAALIHDLLIALGIFTVMGKSLTLDIVSALLIILGYSVNDTIVVFDRIRETMSDMYGKSMGEIINLAINRTLGRTVFTSGSTLIMILAMLFFGGVGLKDFSLILFIGIVVGTYSSIFVASALVYTYITAREKKVGMEKVRGRTKTVKIGT